MTGISWTLGFGGIHLQDQSPHSSSPITQHNDSTTHLIIRDSTLAQPNPFVSFFLFALSTKKTSGPHHRHLSRSSVFIKSPKNHNKSLLRPSITIFVFVISILGFLGFRYYTDGRGKRARHESRKGNDNSLEIFLFFFCFVLFVLDFSHSGITSLALACLLACCCFFFMAFLSSSSTDPFYLRQNPPPILLFPFPLYTTPPPKLLPSVQMIRN